MDKEQIQKLQIEWREQVRDVFCLYELELTDEQIDYYFLSSPNRAKRVLDDTQFHNYLRVWKEYY